MEEKSEKTFSVWISFCHDQTKHVEALKDELKAKAADDINVFASKWFKKSNFAAEMKECIQNSDAYVILVSSGFPDSEWIKTELSQIAVYGDESHREIFPLLVESCELPKDETGDKHILQEILEGKTRQLDSLGDAKSEQYKNIRAPLTYETMALKVLNHFGIKLKIL